MVKSVKRFTKFFHHHNQTRPRQGDGRQDRGRPGAPGEASGEVRRRRRRHALGQQSSSAGCLGYCGCVAALCRRLLRTLAVNGWFREYSAAAQGRACLPARPCMHAATPVLRSPLTLRPQALSSCCRCHFTLLLLIAVTALRPPRCRRRWTCRSAGGLAPLVASPRAGTDGLEETTDGSGSQLPQPPFPPVSPAPLALCPCPCPRSQRKT